MGGHIVVVFFAGVCFWVGVGGHELFEGEAEGRGVEGALGGGFVAVDGEGDIVGGVLVFVLRAA